MQEKNIKTAMCKKCYMKTWHTSESAEIKDKKPHYNCGGEIVLIDYSELPDLIAGERYTFQDKNGAIKRYTWGRTTGWRPVGLLLHNCRSRGSSLTVRKVDILNSVYSSIIKLDTHFF